MTAANRAAFYGLLLVVPFILLNVVVALRVEPLFEMIGGIEFLTSSLWLPTLLMLLFPVAFFVTIRPVLQNNASGNHRIFLLNLVWGAVILAFTIAAWTGLSHELIVCEILNVPNCD